MEDTKEETLEERKEGSCFSTVGSNKQVRNTRLFTKGIVILPTNYEKYRKDMYSQ